MPNIGDAAKRLGMSERAVRLRVAALRPTIDRYLRRGANGEQFLTDGAWAMLERLEALRQLDGLTINAAAELVQRELAEHRPEPRQPLPTDEALALRMLLEERARRIAQLEAEVAYLRERLADVLPLALPRPRPWWMRFFVRGQAFIQN